MTRMLVVALLTLGDPERVTGGYLYHHRMARLASRHGARVEFVSFPDRPFPLAALDAPLVLRRALATGAEAFVLDSIAAAFLGPWLGLSRLAQPLIAMLHQPPGGMDHGPLRTTIQAPLDRLAYARACRLLVASDSLADELASNGFARERMRVVPPGRDIIQGDVTAVPNLRCGRTAAFLSIANWVPRKGLHTLLDAFARLPPDTGTLHLAGDDRLDRRYTARLRTQLSQPNLRHRVVVHGALPREDVAALYAGADVFVLPSLKDPYGTVYGEAMAMGLPVVGWRTGNLPYLADHGREGLLLRPGDVDELARAMELLAMDESLRRHMGHAAAQRALQRPTWEDSAAMFFAAIREVVEAES